MRGAVELSNVHYVVLILEHRSLIVIHVEIIGRAENGHDAREACGPGLAIHAIASVLSFVGSDDGKQIVLFQEIARGGV